AFVLVARPLRRDADPWPRIATFFLAYLLLTPWVFYWHEIPLLGIVAAIPWGLTSLVAVALSITLVAAAPAPPCRRGRARPPGPRGPRRAPPGRPPPPPRPPATCSTPWPGSPAATAA